MTADIKFSGFKPVKPSSLKWSRSIDNYSDTCSIFLPAMCRLKQPDRTYDSIPTGQAIKEGTAVEVYAGYDGKNDLQFKGFVKRINFKVPMELECEGYSYQLRRKVINKSFGKSTVRDLLNHLVEGTDIKLSDKMPERIVLEPVTFQNYTALQVLDFLKEKYLLTVFFQFDQLYVGWLASYSGPIVKHRLNWNVIKDDQLLFNTYTGSVVHIELESRKKTGGRVKKKASNVLKPGNVKKVKTHMQEAADMQLAANDEQIRENKKGYSGALTGFLKPHVEPGMTTEIIDTKYQERNGRYFIEAVNGSFSTSGGRQVVKIGFALQNS